MILAEEWERVCRLTIDEENSSKFGKPVGNYVTIYIDYFVNDNATEELAQIIAQMLSDLCDIKSPNVLVAGLGNDKITSDSLGVRTAEKVLATAHFGGCSEFGENGTPKVYIVTPRVMAQTGFETFKQLNFIAKGISADCLIVIDSLACTAKERLAKTIQITDAGISPGSGVNNYRKELSRKAFGIPIISIGVPTVIKLPSDDNEPLILVPRDIDRVIKHFSNVISNAINKVLCPELTYSEIQELLSACT